MPPLCAMLVQVNTKEVSPMRCACCIHHNYHPVRHTSIIFILWKVAQCVAPLTQCAVPPKLKLFATILWPRNCSKYILLFWMKISLLSTINNLYTKDFNFSLHKSHFVMFAFDLFFKLFFWVVCFIFACDELNALIFCFPCTWWRFWILERWPRFPLKLLHIKNWDYTKLYTWKDKILCFS